MKSFQCKLTLAPRDDGGPGDLPAPQDPRTTQHADHEPAAETAPMPKPTRRGCNAEVDFRGERRSNATHSLATDPHARLFRKSRGPGAVLCFMGYTLTENRNGPIAHAKVTHPDGHAERRAALDMIHRPSL